MSAATILSNIKEMLANAPTWVSMVGAGVPEARAAITTFMSETVPSNPHAYIIIPTYSVDKISIDTFQSNASVSLRIDVDLDDPEDVEASYLTELALMDLIVGELMAASLLGGNMSIASIDYESQSQSSPTEGSSFFEFVFSIVFPDVAGGGGE